jgi:putative ABC transport system permease protein
MRLLRKLRSLFLKEKLDAEMDAEMRAHIELQTERNIAAGMDADEARYAAMRRFGNLASLQETVREGRTGFWLDQGWQDVRLTLRSLRKQPGYFATVVFTLALGIGANTTIFSFFRGILLRPLPLAEPARTVLLKPTANDYGEIVGSAGGLYAADFLELQGKVSAFESQATYTSQIANLIDTERPEMVYGAVVSPDFFRVVGLRPLMGRVFSAADGLDGRRLAVISPQLWQGKFGGDPAVVGRVIVLNNVSVEIVGVAPADFELPETVDFWVSPAREAPEGDIGQPAFDANGRGNPLRTLIGRLRPGVTVDQAESELRGLIARLPNPNQVDRPVHLVSLEDHFLGNVRPALTILLGCVGLVLLLTCLNVANLMLSRAVTRQRELSVRLALGSSPRRIAGLLLTESLLVALTGGALGVAAGDWLLRLLVGIAPESVPRLAEVQMDGTVLGFALAISLLTGVGCALAPIMGRPRTTLMNALKDGLRGSSGGVVARRLRACLVGGEIAASVVLLVAAGLLLRSFAELRDASWGIEPRHIVSARVAFLDQRYQQPPAQLAAHRAVMARLATEPGFEAVASSVDRVGQSWFRLQFAPQGQVFPRKEESPQAQVHVIDAAYFDTMGIKTMRGRGFDLTDNEQGRKVAVIDSNLARRYFPSGDALGKQLTVSWWGGDVPVEIVGVVGDVKSDGPEVEPTPEIYVPFDQTPFNSFFVYARTTLGAGAFEARLRQVLREVDANAPVALLASMEQVIDGPVSTRRFPLQLLAAFAGLALTLAAIGIYAVTAYGVNQRTREIGIRMALGAQPRFVIRQVLWEGLRPVFAGLGSGLVAAVLVALAMRKMLFSVAPLDATTFAGVAIVLIVVASAACILPARRAAKVDPMIALRAE